MLVAKLCLPKKVNSLTSYSFKLYIVGDEILMSKSLNRVYISDFFINNKGTDRQIQNTINRTTDNKKCKLNPTSQHQKQ